MVSRTMAGVHECTHVADMNNRREFGRQLIQKLGGFRFVLEAMEKEVSDAYTKIDTANREVDKILMLLSETKDLVEPATKVLVDKFYPAD